MRHLPPHRPFNPSRSSRHVPPGGSFVVLALVILLAVAGCTPARTATSSQQAGSQQAADVRQSSGSSTQVTTWTLVITASAAEPRPAVPPQLRTVLYQAAITSRRPGGAIVTLVVAGRPTQTVDLTPMRGQRVEHSQGRREHDVQANLTAMDRLVASATAGVPGLDTISLVDIAARANPTADIEVLSSGLATQGPLSILGNGWPQEDPTTLVAYLTGKGYLPAHLAGRDVRFYYLGDVAGTQPQLTQPLRTGLANLYVASCRKAAARSCTVGEDLPGQQPPTATLPVPAVQVPQLEYRSHGRCQSTASIPSQLLFAPDSSALSHGADVVLRPIADKVTSSAASNDPTATWIIAAITGHTFDAGPGDGVQLSRRRAQAVRVRLIALGVEAALIKKVDGVGESQPAVPTSLPDGRPNPAAPERDRRVEVVMKLVQCTRA